MIKAIFFDFDGVLTADETGSITTCKYLSKTTGIEFPKLRKSMKKFNKDLLLGKTTHSQIWDQFCSELNFKIDIKHLHGSFTSTPINKDVFELAKKLKNNYKTGIITDNKVDRIDALIDKHKLNKYFDTIVISADVGSDKEDEKIFEIAIKSLELKYKECIFIDNKEKNLHIPRKLGMQTILYDFENNNIKNLKRKLEILNITI